MRDMDMEMGGEFVRLSSVVAGGRFHEGFMPCEGGCGRLMLTAAFCPYCAQLNRQMEAKRLADVERSKLFQKMKRSDAGIAEYDAEGADRLRVTDNPLAMLGVGLVTLFGGFVALWYASHLLAGFGIWLSAHGL